MIIANSHRPMPKPMRPLFNAIAILSGISAVAAYVSGCAVGPNYKAPATSTLPGGFSQNVSNQVADPAVLSQWWTVFQDRQLESLIKQTAETNLDIRIATARLKEVRAQRLAANGSWFPSVNGSGSYTRSRPSENAVGGRSLQVFRIPLENDDFSGRLDMSWELDVFGGTRRGVEAAKADLAASAEARREVLVSVLAEVGLVYMDLRGFQKELAVAQDNLITQEKSLKLTQDRFKAGLANELDTARAEAQVARTRAQIPQFEEGVTRAIHHLSVLMSRPPADLLSELKTGAPIPTTAMGVPVGLPSDLIRRRPDIRRAERELAASTARIGVATADLFPKFFLTGAVGLQSLESSDFFDGGSKLWSLGPSLRWPLFAGGKIRQGIRVQEARQEQALLRYEQTVLRSLEEVENALLSFGREQERRRALLEAERATRRAATLADVQHRAGLVDFLTVLEAERSLLATQDDLARSDRQLGQNLIRLYKALGGGWDPERSGDRR